MSHFEGTKILWTEDPNPSILSSGLFPIWPSFKPSLSEYYALANTPDQIFSIGANERYMIWPATRFSTLNVNYMYSEGINGMLGSMMRNSLRFNVGENEPSRLTEFVPPIPGGVYEVSKKPSVLLTGPNSGECGRRFAANPLGQYQYNMTGSSYYYGGIESFDPGEDVQLCRVAHLIGGAGDLTGYSLYCQVWSKSGNDLDTMLAESSAIVGTTELGALGTSYPFPVVFFFDPAYTLLNGTTYAIVVTMKAVDGTNYWKSWRGPNISAPLGNWAAWNSSGVRQTSNGYEPSFILYVKV